MTATTSRFVLVAFALSALTGCGRSSPEEVETAAVVPVTVEAAATGTLRSARKILGYDVGQAAPERPRSCMAHRVPGKCAPGVRARLDLVTRE